MKKSLSPQVRGVCAAAFLASVSGVSAATAYVDFSRNDGTNGNSTVGQDAFGHVWNNMAVTTQSVPAGLVLNNLVNGDNTPTTISLTMSANWQANGILNGGLTSPSAALLGDFAVNTVTQDYFFVNPGSASITIGGLTPGQIYTLDLFGTRNTSTSAPFNSDGSVRTTTYSVTDVNGLKSQTLQTSGPNAGSNGSFGNDDTIVTLSGLVPNASNQIVLNVAAASPSAFAYIGGMKITSVPEPGTATLLGVFALGLLRRRRK